MLSFSSQAINPSLPIMKLNNGNLILSLKNNLSLGDIAKINRKYSCQSYKRKRFDKGDNLENAIPFEKFRKKINDARRY